MMSEDAGVVTPSDPDRHDHGAWKTRAKVEKWATREAYEAGLPPAEVVEAEDNVLTTAGIARILSLAIGAGGTPYSNASCRLGVGNGTTNESANDTDLSAASGSGNRFFKKVSAGYPSLSGTTLTFQAVFAETEANFQWNEWGIDNGTVDGTTVSAPLLNHRRVRDGGNNPSSLGTKVSGVWTLTTSITLA